MGAVYFYHLTRGPVESTLRTLLEKSLQAGWRVAVRGRDSERMKWLDEKLWLGPEEEFLPHGLTGGEFEADQPVVLTTGAAGNAPTCWMGVDGAEIAPEEINAAERCCILFDGHDPAAVERARGQWKTLKEAGCTAQYWSEESGRWEKKAQSGG